MLPMFALYDEIPILCPWTHKLTLSQALSGCPKDQGEPTRKMLNGLLQEFFHGTESHWSPKHHALVCHLNLGHLWHLWRINDHRRATAEPQDWQHTQNVFFTTWWWRLDSKYVIARARITQYGTSTCIRTQLKQCHLLLIWCVYSINNTLD